MIIKSAFQILSFDLKYTFLNCFGLIKGLCNSAASVSRDVNYLLNFCWLFSYYLSVLFHDAFRTNFLLFVFCGSYTLS